MDAITNKNFARALQYFPKWMQIRRRPYKSTSGHLLRAVIEEMTSIYKEVDEYTKDFFLVNYAGREDSIISQIYVANIGKLEDGLKLDNEFTITENLNEFYKNKKYAYYDNGNLYFKLDEVDGTPIGYIINKFHYTVNLKQEPVWNIFDEFAWFAGIDRLPNESNLSLSNRTYDALRTKNNKNNNILFDDPNILNTYKHRFNSTEFGLKYLIKNLLSAYAGIAFKDIKIDKLNNINIQEVIKDQKVYDYIAKLNKDIAREKIWDITFWENEFKKLDYLPHIWDQPVEYYLDGVGYYDSLKVTTSNLISSSDTTDVSIIGYKKSNQKVSQYLLNSNKNVNIGIGLKKFDLKLKPVQVEYNLKATSTVKVDPATINFKSYKTYNGEYRLPLEDFVDYEVGVKNVTIKNKGLLVNDTNKEVTYKVIAYPKYQGGNIYLTSFKIDNTEQLNNEFTNDYFIKENGAISYLDNYFYGTRISDFASSSNVINTKDGIKLDTSKSTVGTLSIPLTDNMRFKTINYSIKDTPVNIINRFDLIKLNNFKYNQADNYLYIDSDVQGQINIDQIITSLEFEIDKLDNETNTGSCRVLITDDNNNILASKELNTDTKNMKFSFESEDAKRKHISIIKIGQRGFKIKYINATANGLVFSINGQPLSKSLNTYSIPDNPDNKILTLSLHSYLGISNPVINYISIAGEYANFKYYEKSITVSPNSQVNLKIKSRDTVLKLYKDNNIIDDNYDTYDSFIGPGRLPLLVDKQNISKSEFPILTGQINKHNVDYINVDSETKYITLTFDHYEKQIESLSLLNILTNHYSFDKSNDAVFITYDGRVIIYNKNMDQSAFKEVEILGAYFELEYNKIISEIPATLLVNYIHDARGLIKTTEASTENKVYKILLATKNSSNHTLHHSETIVQNQKEYPIILDNFIPKLSAEQVYFVEINLPDGYNQSTQYIRYQHKNKEVLSKWCLLGNNINILTPEISIFANMWNDNESDYNISVNKKLETTLFASELSLQDVYQIDNVDYNLSEYILSVPSYATIVYNEKRYTETIELTEDGLGKFKYSNVSSNNIELSIGGTALVEDEYVLYETPGIIQVNSIYDHDSLSLQATYTYKHPSKIVFTNLDKLYELVEYNINAYDTETLMTIKDMKDGDSKNLNIANNDIDKVYAKALDPNFTAVVVNNVVSVYRNSLDNKVAIKSGYYYEAGKEYYFPVYETEVDHHKEHYVDLNSTKKQGSLVKMQTERQNFIPNSLMDMKVLNPLCYVNFKEQKEVSEISSLHSLTTANTFNNWTFQDCDPTLIELNKNYVINFKFDKEGYAIFRIDKYAYATSYCYIKKAGNLKISLYKEKKLNGFRLQKKPLLEKVEDFIINDDFAFSQFNIDKDFYYYIVVTGIVGSIEEIVLSDKLITEPHSKNIDKYSWDLTEKKNSIANEIIFDTFNYTTDNNIDVDDNDVIQYGTTIDYDATLLATADLKRCQLDKVLLRGNKLITLNEPGTVTTEIFDLINNQYKAKSEDWYKYLKNILYMAAKINTLSEDKFTIRVLGSENYYSKYATIAVIENGDYVLLSNDKLVQYIRFEIDIPANSSISSIDVYNIYDELEDQAIESLPVAGGDFISRLFMVSEKGTYNLDTIDADIKGDVSIKVRSLRKQGVNNQFTAWKDLYRSGTLTPVSFTDTDTFQFKIELLNNKSTIKLNRIGLTAI